MHVIHNPASCQSGATTLAVAIIQGFKFQGRKALHVMPTKEDVQWLKRTRAAEAICAREFDQMMIDRVDLAQFAAVVLDDYQDFPKLKNGPILERLKRRDQRGERVPHRVIVMLNL